MNAALTLCFRAAVFPTARPTGATPCRLVRKSAAGAPGGSGDRRPSTVAGGLAEGFEAACYLALVACLSAGLACCFSGRPAASVAPAVPAASAAAAVTSLHLPG